MHPSSRRADVIVQDVSPDLLVYDQLRDVAHSLGPVPGYVYRHADGTRSVAELSTALSAALGVEADTQVVEAALWELERVHLLELPPSATKPRGVSRRTAVRRFGKAALAAATIASIAAPTPAMAKSNGNPNPGEPRGRGPDGNGPPGHSG